MAIANDAQGSYTSPAAGSDPWSWDHAVGSLTDGYMLVAVGTIGDESDVPPDSVDVGGTEISGNLVDSWAAGTNSRPGIYVYELVAPPSGTQTITVSFSGGGVGFGISLTFSGVNQTTPYTAATTSEGFSTSPSGSISSSSGERVVDVFNQQNGVDITSVTDDEGQPLVTLQGGGANSTSSCYGMSSWEAGAATVTASWTINKDDSYSGVLVSLAPASTDTTAPTLTNASASADGSDGYSGSVDTDEGNGTLYHVVTQSSTAPSATQVKNGQDHNGTASDASSSQAISSTGTKNVGQTGVLSPDTQYYIHYMHEDAATNQSSVVSSTSFTTQTFIGGQVTDGGTPVQGALVYLIDQGSDTVHATTITDANGDYAFEGIPAGTYHAVVEDSGHTAASKPDLTV